MYEFTSTILYKISFCTLSAAIACILFCRHIQTYSLMYSGFAASSITLLFKRVLVS